MAKNQLHETNDASTSERVLWTVLLGVVSGASGILASRGAEWLWCKVRGRSPPKSVGPLRMVAERAGLSAATRVRV